MRGPLIVGAVLLLVIVLYNVTDSGTAQQRLCTSVGEYGQALDDLTDLATLSPVNRSDVEAIRTRMQETRSRIVEDAATLHDVGSDAQRAIDVDPLLDRARELDEAVGRAPEETTVLSLLRRVEPETAAARAEQQRLIQALECAP